MNETGMVFSETGETLFWHEPFGRTAMHLPDSDVLWDFLWANREAIGGVAHTHPWRGVPQPSLKDVTTFRAVERALGRILLWPIVTQDQVRYFKYNPVQREYLAVDPPNFNLDLGTLREKSGI